MLGLAEIRNNRNIVNSIDWSMTPEKAIEMYLEWGTGWVRGNDFVHGKNDVSVYFVLYDWEEPPQATLIRRTVNGADEIAKVQIPADLFHKACDEDGYKPGVGVHPINWELKEWLCDAVGASSTNLQIN
jgi:hypothetical protein